MSRNFEGNDARRDRLARRQVATLDRLRAAVDALAEENQGLQAEVGELGNTMGNLRRGIEDISGSVGDDVFRMPNIQTGAIRQAARQLGQIVDNWQECGAQSPAAPSARPTGDAA